ncbi:phage terminase large subunit [soil metagenome]
MTELSVEEYDALTRLDFKVFAERCFAELHPGTPFPDNFHIDLICAELDKVRRGEITRLILNLPPRGLKSHLASVAFPAFLQGHSPSTKLITASYGQELADDLARSSRAIMESAWYRRVFPQTQLNPQRHAVHDFHTAAHGFRRSTSVGGVLTGFGADVIIVDDPLKPEAALSDVERMKTNSWYRSTLVTRQNQQNVGAIVLVQQRLHEDDLAGYVLGIDDWMVISLPAIALRDEEHLIETPHGSYIHRRREGEALHPERESLTDLRRLERSLGTEFFAAQYLQAPTAPGGNIVKLEWFMRFDLAAPPAFEQVVQSWDTAQKARSVNDPSVCTTWGIAQGHAYLIDVLRVRLEYPELKRTILAEARRLRATVVLIEDKGSGTSLLQDVKREGLYIAKGIEPKLDKVMRLYAQTAVIENGRVSLPHRAPWLPDYERELMAFPKSRHDDQVDSTSQFLEWMNWTSVEPPIFDYIRDEERKRLRGTEDDERIFRVVPPFPSMGVSGIKGNVYPLQYGGCYHVSAEDARILLGSGRGWRLADGEPPF